MAAATASGSRMSPITRFTGPWAIARSGWWRLPRTMLSSTTISPAPSRTSRSAMWEPTRPAPPVMRHRLPRIGFLPVPQHAGRPARHYGKVRHVGRHHGPRAHDRALAHRHAGQEHGVRADVGPAPHDHRLDAEVGLDDRDVARGPRVLGAEHLRARAPAHVVLEHEVARVHVRLRSDPHVVADPAGAIEPALDVRLGADEDAGADLERLQVLEADAGPDAHPVAEPPAGGPPDGAPHHRVELAVARREARVQVEQAEQVVAGPQAGREPDLELGVRHRLAPAVDGA